MGYKRHRLKSCNLLNVYCITHVEEIDHESTESAEMHRYMYGHKLLYIL